MHENKKSCRKQNPVVVDAEVYSLITKKTNDADAVVYTDGSGLHQNNPERQRCLCIDDQQHDDGDYVSDEGLIWLESFLYVRVCVQSDSLSLIRKIQAGLVHKLEIKVSRWCSGQ